MLIRQKLETARYNNKEVELFIGNNEFGLTGKVFDFGPGQFGDEAVYITHEDGSMSILELDIIKNVNI